MVAALNLLASFSLAVPIGECSSASSIILCKKLIYSEVVGESIALFARQLDPGFTPNDIPESCVATCQTFSQTLTSGVRILSFYYRKLYLTVCTQSCTTLSCLCTDAIASGIDACLSCAVDANIPDFNKTVADQTINGAPLRATILAPHADR